MKPRTFDSFVSVHFGRTQDFADFLGVVYQTAYYWRKAPGKIRTGLLQKISNHTGVSQADIIELINNQITDK